SPRLGRGGRTRTSAPRRPDDSRSQAMPIRPHIAILNDAAEGITEEMIRSVVVEFYRRARQDAQLGPIFDGHITDWPEHLDRLTDFWSSAMRRTGRYTGNPVDGHRRI